MNRFPQFAYNVAIILSLFALSPLAAAQDHQDHGEHGDHDDQHAHMEEMENAEIADPDVILDVDGMHCEHCAYSLRKELDSLEAVNQTQVVVEDDQQIRIALVEGQAISEEDIQEAVQASGFAESFELKAMRFPKEEG